ncbi:MAG: PAS domain S-box protein [Hyphomonadaceae bacterium]|nr:PAS domain S-box protein [Hyphomonadaceae bacterium]
MSASFGLQHVATTEIARSDPRQMTQACVAFYGCVPLQAAVGMTDQGRQPSETPDLTAGADGRSPIVLDDAFQLPGSTLKDLIGDNRFLVVPETMVDGLIVIDEVGTIHYVNPACTLLFNYARDALIGQNVKMLMPSPFREHHDAYLARHRETGVKRIIGIGRELQGLKSDGTIFPMYLSVGQARTGDEGIFVGIIYDLTEKKRTEETILHHQKLDAIGLLSGGIAHDFNNILNVIGGNLEMIAAGDLPPAGRRAVARAQEAAAKAARITQRLLAFARKQPLNQQLIDVNKALEDMAEMLQRTIGEAVTVEMHLSPKAGQINTDIDQFETAILNLAVNARDAMPSGGLIVVEAEQVTVGDEPGENGETPPGEYTRISVSDTGEGMTPEVRARAIEPFFTTKDVGSGTGLGLSMVYGFMKQIGGHARLYSEVGHGTRVSLFFPRIVSPLAAAPNVSHSSIPVGRGETVLVVEDDPDVRQITVSRLEGLGYRVRIATDGHSAMQVVKNCSDVQLALIDVVMPGGMDGHAVADEIEKMAPGIKLILTSGYSPRMAAKDAQQTRAFLPKPSTRAQVARIVRSILDS